MIVKPHWRRWPILFLYAAYAFLNAFQVSTTTDNSAPRHGSQNGAVLHVPSKPLEIALVKFCLASTICDYTRNLRSILQCKQYLCRLDFECCFRIVYRNF